VSTPHDDLLAAIELLADAIAERVAAKLRGSSDEWIDQHSSPLGSKRHCALVRSLTTAGDQRASKIGRRYLLSRDALAEAMIRQSQTKSKAPETGETVTSRLQQRLRLVGSVE
jgi:hypothetical protein